MRKNKVAFDTNTFIYLSQIHSETFRKQNFFKKHFLLKNTLHIFEGLIKNRFLTPVILPKVKEEIIKYETKHNIKILQKLIDLGCVCDDFFTKNDNIKAFELAQKYSEHVILDDVYQVFDEIQEKKTLYPLYKGKIIANDAVIMGQATIKNYPVVTYDGHFIKALNPLYIRQVNTDNGFSPECFPYRPDEYLMKFSLENDNFVKYSTVKNTVKEKTKVRVLEKE